MDYVAPLAGAWIEIPVTGGTIVQMASLPSRERGLKYQPAHLRISPDGVAPLAGAWIEITSVFGGPWIRISSLPSRERGLKSA